MKFTCDKCSAQYMISDDKIGPSGVKVRCKKCQNVIVVRRPDGSGAAEAAKQAAQPAQPQAGDGAQPEKGIDVELGQAFDHAFGNPPVSTPKPGKGPDLASTQMMGEDDAAKITATPGAAAAAGTTEWYVAIGQAQVGPLPASEVKKKWEAGDVGPDSLVWRPGMGEWSPLSTVTELAAFLSPIPRPASKTTRDGARVDMRGDSAPTPAPLPEPTWKPVGASALAALASEEIATRKAPEPKPQAPRPASSSAKSLMDALPDGGGVDPTGAIPLSIKALEQTVEKKIERRTSVARGAQEARHRRGIARAVAVTVVIVVLVIGGGGAAAFWYMNGKKVPTSLSSLTGGAAPAAEPAVPTPAPVAPPRAAPPPAAVAAAPAPAPAVVQPPAAAPPPVPAAAAAESRRSSRGESSKQSRHEQASKTTPRVAAAEPPPPPPPPEPKKKDLLDFEGHDSALDDALGKTSSGRSVYVPPARRGGSSDVPGKLSSGDINAAVAGRIDSLRRCVSEQKARDPEATGTLKMRWMISGDGSVRDVKCLTSEFAQGTFAQCIAGVVRSIKFPRSQTSGQEVTFPFNF